MTPRRRLRGTAALCRPRGHHPARRKSLDLPSGPRRRASVPEMMPPVGWIVSCLLGHGVIIGVRLHRRLIDWSEWTPVPRNSVGA